MNANSTDDRMSQLFNNDNLSPREQVTDWETGNLKKKGLDSKIGGTFVGFWKVPANGKYRAQIGVALRDFKDPSIVYGFNVAEYFESTLSKYDVGDDVGFHYYADKPSKEAGMSATKAIRVYNLTEVQRTKDGVKSNGTVMGVEEDAQTEEDEDPLKMNELGKLEQDLAADGQPV